MELRKKIKVLIVDDSLVFRETMARGVSLDPNIEVVGTASDPYDARDKIIAFKPDVMTLDVEMPKMNGIDFLKKLMPQYPIPVIVVSAVGDNVFNALDAGAVDFVTKWNGKSGKSIEYFISELIIKIKIASTAKVGHWKKENLIQPDTRKSAGRLSNKVIAIGASTGGTEAIASTLKMLSKDTPGIVIVQHMPPNFTKMFAERLNHTCILDVKEAESGDIIYPGKVYIAPGDKHMLVKQKGKEYVIECISGEKVSGHCPSVDVLFQSVAETYKSNAIAVILTGMGYDGAKGILSLRKLGARTIGQDESSCVVYGMPKVAYNIGGVEIQVPLHKIPSTIYKRLDDMR